MNSNSNKTLVSPDITVIIPAFKASRTIGKVIQSIGNEVGCIVVVDDGCPDGSGDMAESVGDPRVLVHRLEENQGVGGAMIAGYQIALGLKPELIVKLDADGQMNPALISKLVMPIVSGIADYAKGNRFHNFRSLRAMPKIRLLGNSVLSIWNKMSSGYWSINDPTNGFTAISKEALRDIDLARISKSYFFESDVLFNLALQNAVVLDVPMDSSYGDEESSLRIRKVLLEFPLKHTRNLFRRLAYKYFLREWSAGTIELIASTLLIASGTWLALSSYFSGVASGLGVTPGQITLSAVGLILGFQLFLSFLNYDIATEPKTHKKGI